MIRRRVTNRNTRSSPDNNARPDALVEDLGGLADVPAEVLQRAVVAVAVVHQRDRRGRCLVCAPWWRRDLAGTCATGELLRAAVREARVPRWLSA